MWTGGLHRAVREDEVRVHGERPPASVPPPRPPAQPSSPGPSTSDRDSFAARRELPFRASVAAVMAGGAVVLSSAAAHLDAATVLGMQPAFWAACALLLGVELRPLLTAGARDPNGHLLTSAFVFALLLRYGLDVAVVVQAVATTAIDLSRRKALWRTAFNVSQYTLSWTAAATRWRWSASARRRRPSTSRPRSCCRQRSAA